MGGVILWLKACCKTNRVKILWVGKFDFRKQLGLALKTVAALPNRQDVELHVVGTGSDADVATYHSLANSLDLGDTVIWHGAIPHTDVLSLMQRSDLFLFTSIAEGTPHVVLEAIQNCLPVVCFNTCGQGDTVNDSFGVKVDLSTPEQSVYDLANAIEHLVADKYARYAMRRSCHIRQNELSWDRKVRQLLSIYQQTISE